MAKYTAAQKAALNKSMKANQDVLIGTQLENVYPQETEQLLVADGAITIKCGFLSALFGPMAVPSTLSFPPSPMSHPASSPIACPKVGFPKLYPSWANTQTLLEPRKSLSLSAEPRIMLVPSRNMPWLNPSCERRGL